MIKYTLVFNQVKRSNYDKGCDAFNNFLGYEGPLSYLPTLNACFRKCLDYICKRNFSHEYKEFTLSSDRCENLNNDTSKSSIIFMKHGIDTGVYNLNSERIVPRTVKQKIFVCINTKTISEYFGS